ncbi:isoleucyl-tRNA synthetase [Babesia ovis]|uniref:isoleucine--tRNA ligase n=1 Tax=Babesia ovis TaxID=5869 RepID=A0A9W5TBD5_BABOV|nr:isoleucyl-tRNA synthetase [Babesia ovis]
MLPRVLALILLAFFTQLACDSYVLQDKRAIQWDTLGPNRNTRAAKYTNARGRQEHPGVEPTLASSDEGATAEPSDEAIKGTLNLPVALWPKRSHFSRASIERQIRIQKFWKDHDVYRLLLERRLSAFGLKGLSDSRVTQRTSVILDGPPYANGFAHYGHFLNKTIKDVLLRASLLDGKLALYLPGWDCHGVPIESKVLDTSGYKLGEVRNGMTDAGVPRAVEIRQRCSQVATQSIDSQMSAFETAGVWGFWKDYYATYHFYYERHVMDAFNQLLERKLVYRARCPQHYSAKSGSVLSYAELQSKKLDILTALVGFELVDTTRVMEALDFHRPLADVRMVCWTTMPWTIPANRGLLINALSEYDVYYRQGTIYVLNNNEDIGIFLPKEYVGRLSGSLFVGSEVLNPVTAETYVVHDHLGVVEDKGTGIIHAAPAHGLVDFRMLSSNAGLTIKDIFDNDPNTICNIIDEDERFYDGVHPLLNGLSIHELDSEKLGAILGPALIQTKIENLPVDVDGRFGNRTHVRLTKQWCLSLLERKACLPKLEDMKIYPDASRNYLRNIIANRSQDWCLSRQRIWGTPIPITFVDADALENPDLARLYNIDDQLPGTMKGEYCLKVDIDTLPHYELGDRVFRKLDYRSDTMDVWFESALAQRVTIYRLREILADMSKNALGQSRYEFHGLTPEYVVEGQDQFRGWYQSSLLVNSLLGGVEQGCPLARHVITHGFVNDETGQKLSKRNQHLCNTSNVVSSEATQGKSDQSAVSCDSTDNTAIVNDGVVEIAKDSYSTTSCVDNTEQQAFNNTTGVRQRCDTENKTNNSVPASVSSDLMQMLGSEYYEDPELIDLDDPQCVGADVLRLWACSSDFLQKDIYLNKDNLAEARDLARKVTNFFKYAIGVTHDCKVKNDRCRIRVKYFNALDIYMLKLSYALVSEARTYFREGCLHKVVRALEMYLTRFSNIYITYSKDRLYCDVKNGWSRTCAQIILRKIMRNVLAVVAPIMPHMAEDVYQSMYNLHPPVKRKDMSTVKSVFGDRWLRLPAYLQRVDVEQRVEEALELRNLVNQFGLKREDKELLIVCDSDDVITRMLDFETNMRIDLRLLLGVANVRLMLNSKRQVPSGTSVRGNGYTLFLQPISYHKCRRCWLYREDVSDGFCERCGSICAMPNSGDATHDGSEPIDTPAVDDIVNSHPEDGDDYILTDADNALVEEDEYFDLD